MTTQVRGEGTTNERIIRKRRTKRQAILDSAADVLAREGYPSLSLEKVAAELDLTKAALYHYFPSKDDLVADVIDYLGTFSLERMQEAVSDDSENGRGRLRNLIKAHLQIVVFDRPEAGQLFARHDIWWNQPHHEAISSFRKRHAQLFRAAVEAGVEDGSLTPLNVEVSLQCLLAACASASYWTGLAKSARNGARLKLVTQTLLALFGVPMDDAEA